jgi:hypothetical protein
VALAIAEPSVKYQPERTSCLTGRVNPRSGPCSSGPRPMKEKASWAVTPNSKAAASGFEAVKVCLRRGRKACQGQAAMPGRFAGIKTGGYQEGLIAFENGKSRLAKAEPR